MSGVRLQYFDVWQAGYGGSSVAVYLAGTSTLASLFYDEALTDVAPNPFTLSTRNVGGVNYGKLAAPVYVGAAIEMTINSIDQTGVIRPALTTLAAEDASDALVTADGGSQARALDTIVARHINALDYGVLLPTSNPSSSAATNNATITSAIGVASANGGGFVQVPPGIYQITQLSIPQGVILCGESQDSTVLQSSIAGNVITLAGDRAGYQNITFDGVNLLASSVGVYSKAQDETYIRNAKIKRFETGLHCIGGRRSGWGRFSIDNCATGAKLHGDLDTSGGDEFRDNTWDGGKVSTCTLIGIDLKYVDKKVFHNRLRHVGIENNTGTGLRVYGARWTDLEGTWFDGNTNDFEMLDGADPTFDDENTVVGFHMYGGTIESNMSFTGKCQDVVFEKVDLSDGTYTLTTVGNTILALDCVESSAVVLAGNDSTQWMRARTTLGDSPGSFGLTTDNVATEGWAYDLAPGERVFIEAIVIANGRNVNDYATYHITRAAHRPGSTLAYDGQTANFTPGATLTGGTSGATARVIADSDSGTTGTLTVRDIIGEFVDDETITDSSGGSALANGVLVHQNAALLGSTVTVSTATETDATWAADFGVTAAKVRILVTGAAAKTVEWTVSARVTSSG